MQASNLRPFAALLLGIVLALGACKSTESAPASEPAAPSHAQITNQVVATAQVAAVDSAARIVMLQREDGSSFRVKCGPEVRNFAQIAVGDSLRVKYTETLEATRLPAGESVQPAGALLASSRAKPGATPAAGVGLAFTVGVKIESIDREREVVVFSVPNGELIARHVVTPEGRGFLKGLKIGDNVQLVYTEVLALSVEKL